MRFTKHHIGLLIISICFSTFLNAQNVEDIIAKHLKAHGGTEKWDAIHSMEIKARFTAFSEENEFYAVKTSKGEYYSDLHIGQHKVKEAFNGTSGWTIDPWHEFLFPRELNKPEVTVFHQKAEFFSPFYKYKEKGRKVEFLGEENVDGIDTYALKLIRPEGTEETWYLDQETFLEYKSISKWVDFGIQQTAETFFEDFQEVNGLIIPFFVERMFGQRDRILGIEEVNLNVEVDEAIFKMPKSEEMQKLAILEGVWDVEIQKPAINKTWATFDHTVSTVSFETTNLMKQNISVDDYYVQSMLLNYSYKADIGKYILTTYNGFTSGLDVFTGGFEDGVFSVDNTKTSFGVAGVALSIMQMKIYDISENAFTMEISSSRDKGESWNTAYKLNFKRKK